MIKKIVKQTSPANCVNMYDDRMQNNLFCSKIIWRVAEKLMTRLFVLTRISPGTIFWTKKKGAGEKTAETKRSIRRTMVVLTNFTIHIQLEKKHIFNQKHPILKKNAVLSFDEFFFQRACNCETIVKIIKNYHCAPRTAYSSIHLSVELHMHMHYAILGWSVVIQFCRLNFGHILHAI